MIFRKQDLLPQNRMSKKVIRLLPILPIFKISPSAIRSIAFSPDDIMLVSGGFDSAVRVRRAKETVSRVRPAVLYDDS